MWLTFLLLHALASSLVFHSFWYLFLFCPCSLVKSQCGILASNEMSFWNVLDRECDVDQKRTKFEFSLPPFKVFNLLFWRYMTAWKAWFLSCYFRDKLMQCHNGHTLCSTCKTRVHNRCPTCRQELGDIRCLALEKVAESLELPCKYYSLGCPEIFPYYSKLKHEAVCNFRPYNCPYAGSECSAAGDIPFLVTHLRDDHKVDMHTGCTFNHRYVKSNPREVENATWMLTVSAYCLQISKLISQ